MRLSRLPNSEIDVAPVSPKSTLWHVQESSTMCLIAWISILDLLSTQLLIKPDVVVRLQEAWESLALLCLVDPFTFDIGVVALPQDLASIRNTVTKQVRVVLATRCKIGT